MTHYLGDIGIGFPHRTTKVRNCEKIKNKEKTSQPNKDGPFVKL
jgi:hypothetical protein